jgi:hypothetical protein
MILFVTDNNDTFNNPTLYSLFSILENRKIKSLLFASETYYQGNFKYVKVVNIPKPRKRRNKVFYTISYIKYFCYSKIFFNFLNKNVKCIIGIDPEGIILAAEIRKKYFTKAHLDYFSFEFFYENHFKRKNKEIEACELIRHLIIQDELRDNILRSINKIPISIKSFYIPVALSDEIDKNECNVDYDIREKLSISVDKKIIVFFGSFYEWSGANIIYDLISGDLQTGNYVIVIHSRFPLDNKNDLHNKIIELTKTRKNIYLTTDYIESYGQTIAYLKQFDIGLVFYVPVLGDKWIGENIYNIGLSSGKFSMFMKAGIPTIASNLPTYKKLNDEYNFGFLIKDKSDLLDILNNEIDLEYYKNNCLKLFNEKINPTQILNEYIDIIIKT